LQHIGPEILVVTVILTLSAVGRIVAHFYLDDVNKWFHLCTCKPERDVKTINILILSLYM